MKKVDKGKEQQQKENVLNNLRLDAIEQSIGVYSTLVLNRFVFFHMHFVLPNFDTIFSLKKSFSTCTY